jgi:uncharacterized Zn finger protein
VRRAERLSVADLVPPAVVEKLATRANLRLGREIVASGDVEFLKFSPSRVQAKVTGVQRRSVELLSDHGELRWRCSCSKKLDLFCKHCVAAALATWERAPHEKSADQPRASEQNSVARTG